MYREAGKQAGLTIEESAELLHVAPRTLCKYESGGLNVSPEIIAAMARIYNAPWLLTAYCNKKCAIGKVIGFEMLNNVDLSPMAIITKYRQEEHEANEAVEKLSALILNKKSRKDCVASELDEIKRWTLELLDLEHVVQILKLRLWEFCPIDELTREHNEKCAKKHYYDPKQPELRAG